MVAADLSNEESRWAQAWLSLVSKVPDPLQLLIPESSADGSVEVFLPEGMPRQTQHTRWVNRIRRHLEDFPSGDAWLLSNVDGWHFGKGVPTVVSSASYGAGGACASHSDDFSKHYIFTAPVDHGSEPEGAESIATLPSYQGRLETNFITR